MKKICFALITICFSVSFIHAQTILMTVEGVKQGAFKGESLNKRYSNKMEVAGYLHEISSPRDVATGQASGKRTHQPLIILKPTGAASPQFFQAATTNEVLKTVIIEVYITDPQTGMEVVAYTITLGNATVSNYKQFIGPLDNEKFNPAKNILYDEIRFTFQKITVENNIAKTLATDDWQSRIN